MQVAWKSALSQDEPGTRAHDRCVKDNPTGNNTANRDSRSCVSLPRAGVDVVAVEVVDEAVFVGGQSLVAPVDKDAAAGAVVRAAVAVTALRNRTFGLRHQPCVGS